MVQREAATRVIAEKRLSAAETGITEIGAGIPPDLSGTLGQLDARIAALEP